MLSSVSNKSLFAGLTLFSTIIADIDSPYSAVGRFKGFRIFQFFMKHRGILHSFTFCIFVSLLFSIFLPILAFPFFLGYSVHLLSDSLTIEGIQPFWPYKRRIEGGITTNSYTEKAIFAFFIFLNIFAVLVKYF